MGITDERLRVIDEGQLVIAGLPPCPPPPPVDLAPILDRLGDLESAFAALTTQVGDLETQLTDLDAEVGAISRLAEDLNTVVTALLGGGFPVAWVATDAYLTGALVIHLGLLYVAKADVAANQPSPDNGAPWAVVDVVSMVP